MSHRARLGLMLWPAPGLNADLARGQWADAYGYDDVWLPNAEGMFDPMALATALAVTTSRVRIATGVVPMFNAPAPVLAAQTSFIAAQAPGRFVLGLGSSTGNMVQRWYGVPFEHPLRQLREYLQLLRQIFAGGKTAFSGQHLQSIGFRLQSPPVPPVPLHLGAMGPRMLALAGELADGVVLNDFTPPGELANALAQIDLGAKRSGRRAEDLEIVKRRAVVVTRNAEEYAATLAFYRQHFAFYASAPAYQAVMQRLGYGAAVDEVRAGYASRDRARISAAISEEMIHRIFLFGDAEHCITQLKREYASGIHTLVVSPQAATPDAFAHTTEALLAARPA